MSIDAPKIDTRTAAKVSARLVGTAERAGLLEEYTTHPDAPVTQYPFEAWREYDPLTRKPMGTSAALIGIFARFAEIVIERLNQVPEKSFLAFLDLLGAARQPPQPARVPLTFTLAAGSSVDALVPQGTQVAAPPAEGEKDPVVFETERPLVVTAAQLLSLVTIDPELDTYGDWSERLAAPSPFTVFQGERALAHVLYLGDSRLLGYEQIKGLSVSITLAEALPGGTDPRKVGWEQYDGTQWPSLPPTADPTSDLTLPGTIDFGAIPPLPEGAVNGLTSRWLRCRLLTPITQSPVAEAGMVRASQLPKIRRIELAVRRERTLAEGIVPDLGFTNAAPLDLSKAFFPLGEKPKPHDTLSLASAEAFSKDGTAGVSYTSSRIELDMPVTNSHLLPGPGSVRPSSDLELAWECWTGSTWQKVGTSTAPAWLALLELDPAPQLKTEEASTFAILQGTAQTGAQVRSTGLDATGGSEERYLAVGGDGRFADKRQLAAGVNVFEFEASYQGRVGKAWAAVLHGAAPAIELEAATPNLPVEAAQIELVVSVSGDDAGEVTTIRVTNASTGKDVERAPATPVPVELAVGRNDLLVEALGADGQRLAATTAMISRHAAAPAADAGGFSDGTFGLCQGGVVTLELPDTMARTAVNGQEGFWLRVRLVDGDYGKDAGYVLKDPVKPEDGFTLVPASFRPPLVAAIRIGYALTVQRSPQVCFAYNQLAFEDCTPAAGGDAPAFAPFVASTEAQRPGMYLGFSLPPGRSAFPNTTIGLYNSAAEPAYGKRAVPLTPETSMWAGTAGSTVTHTFIITNATAQGDDFDIALLGFQWPTTAIGAVTLEAGETYELSVPVDIPVGAQPGDHDRGFVRLRRHSEPDKLYGAVITTGVGMLPDAGPAGLSWQYWDGARWSKLTVQDDSENFTRSGPLEFLAPADLARRELFGQARHWLRVTWDKGEYPVPPRLGQVLLNTTLAVQTITVVNEILGSSNGAERQQFRSTRPPVLAGQQLEVREPEIPSAEEQAVLDEEEGADALNIVTDATGRPREIWVRWHEVPDFYGSGPHDRHYVINHLTGEIRFGDGINGRVPPRGTGNVHLARYQTGGGSRGNRAPGTIAQLKTTVPYVEKAANPQAAAGGAEAETTDALFERMPHTLRHRDRAVTLEDYQDLALLASPEVARARCVPLRDLLADPLGNTPQPGSVSVIVVPRTRDVKPLPTLELLARVRGFVGARAAATASLAVVGPQYIRVDVRAEIAVATPGGASTVERAVHERLAAFLHPLTGGLEGSGWDFGRAPHRSDFFALIESVPGVDHVRYLRITETEDQPGVRKTGRFLVFSGEHQIDLMFEET
jgi:hypothetical protein